MEKMRRWFYRRVIALCFGVFRWAMSGLTGVDCSRITVYACQVPRRKNVSRTLELVR